MEGKQLEHSPHMYNSFTSSVFLDSSFTCKSEETVQYQYKYLPINKKLFIPPVYPPLDLYVFSENVAIIEFCPVWYKYIFYT